MMMEVKRERENMGGKGEDKEEKDYGERLTCIQLL
jgi:hypothetical protein